VSDNESWDESWEFSSGLTDEITIRVTNPHFGYDSEFQDGQVPLFILEGNVIAGDPEGEFSQWYTVGKGWEATQKGKLLSPEDNSKRKTLNRSTNYAHLLNSLREAAEKQGMADALRKRGSALSAEMWDGLELYLEREEYTNEIGGEKREGSRLLVRKIEKMPGAKESHRVRGTEPTTATEPPAVSDLSPMLKAKLRKLAQTVKTSGGTHSTFAEQAFSDVDGVLDNAVAEDAVMDTGAGSIWDQA